MQAGKSYLLVRATVADAEERRKFDHWYETDHLPLAKQKFQAEHAWRFWSRSEPTVHYALYEFRSSEHLRERTKSEDLKILIADFDRNWPNVQRTREFIDLVQDLP